jgi:Ca2+-binding EF-hand superfamily protein
LKGFSTSYSTKKSKKEEERLSAEAVEKLIKQLSEKIEDSGKTKKQVFISMDKNGDKAINRNELVLGLKGLGLHVAVVSNLLKVFDKDNSDKIELNEFLLVLGEDIELSDVEIPTQPLKTKTNDTKIEKK